MAQFGGARLCRAPFRAQRGERSEHLPGTSWAGNARCTRASFVGNQGSTESRPTGPYHRKSQTGPLPDGQRENAGRANEKIGEKLKRGNSEETALSKFDALKHPHSPALSGWRRLKAELRDVISPPEGKRSGLETTKSGVACVKAALEMTRSATEIIRSTTEMDRSGLEEDRSAPEDIRSALEIIITGHAGTRSALEDIRSGLQMARFGFEMAKAEH